jgi:hypothetical protein
MEEIDWFDSLPTLNVSQNVWQEIQTRFKIEYKSKATATSIVAKLPDVKQNPNETVNNYFNRANRILCELKSNIDPAKIDIPVVVLPAEMSAKWKNLNQEVRDTVINHVRPHAAYRR